jgi:hypothetical protein
MRSQGANWGLSSHGEKIIVNFGMPLNTARRILEQSISLLEQWV